jgi:hypothetical protein
VNSASTGSEKALPFYCPFLVNHGLQASSGRVYILSVFLGEKNINRELETYRQQANWTRYQPGQSAGHYESFFQRANHPIRPMAFWIRYTIFSPQNHHLLEKNDEGVLEFRVENLKLEGWN